MQPVNRFFTLDEMLDTPSSQVPDNGPETEAIRRLLAALGEWGVAEVNGAPEPTLEQLESAALDAYRDVAAVA